VSRGRVREKTRGVGSTGLPMKKNIAVSDGTRSDGEPYSVGDGPENSVASPSDPSGPLLEVDHVAKFYGGTQALADVSLKVFRGEVVGLMGHNGAGKSTLIKVITGAEQPTTGEVKIEGRPQGATGIGAARSQGIATVYQELRTIENVSVAENIFYPAIPHRYGFVDRRRLYSDARRLLADQGLAIDPKVPAGKLSQAERQLVEIAAAQSWGARLILFDEPTSSLGATQIDEFLAVVRRQASLGIGIVLVTHKIAEVLEVADRIVVLRDGRVVASGLREEFTRQRLVAELTGAVASEAAPDIGSNDTHPSRGKRVNLPGTEASNVALKTSHLVAGGVVKADVELSKGEIVGLYGLLGSGRTALLSALYGINPVVGGLIELDGRGYLPDGPADALRRGIFLLSEDRKRDGIIAMMSVRNNQAIASLTRFRRGPGFVDRRLLRSTTDDEINRLNIICRPERPVSSLSGGNQQKVLFSRLHLTGSHVLLLDEPTRGVDVGAKREIYGVIRQEASMGRSVLVASSEVEEICELCHRCYVVVDGCTGDLEFAGDSLTPVGLRLAAAGEVAR